MTTNRQPRKKIRVFLVDDHPIVRRGFQLLLSLEPDLAVCGEADCGPIALDRILQLKPDVAIVDLSLKNSNGLELIKQIRAQNLDVKILVFTMRGEPIYAERALRAGANGFLTKEEGAEKAVEALRVLMQGKPYLNAQLTEAMMQRMARTTAPPAAFDLLSDRELEVLELVGAGLGSRQIAQKLNLSIKTIESHREHIKAKLGLKNASALASYAFSWARDK